MVKKSMKTDPSQKQAELSKSHRVTNTEESPARPTSSSHHRLEADGSFRPPNDEQEDDIDDVIVATGVVSAENAQDMNDEQDAVEYVAIATGVVSAQNAHTDERRPGQDEGMDDVVVATGMVSTVGATTQYNSQNHNRQLQQQHTRSFHSDEESTITQTQPGAVRVSGVIFTEDSDSQDGNGNDSDSVEAEEEEEVSSPASNPRDAFAVGDVLSAYLVDDKDGFVEDEYNIEPLKKELQQLINVVDQLQSVPVAEAESQSDKERHEAQKEMVLPLTCQDIMKNRGFWLTTALFLFGATILTTLLTTNGSRQAGIGSAGSEDLFKFPRCFEATIELYDAVDEYIEQSSGPNSTLAQRYGHPMNSWCVSKLQGFESLFSVSRNSNMMNFNEDISHWDVSNAINMSRFLSGAVLFDGNLSAWNVQDMELMFDDAQLFDGHLSAWDVSQVTNMHSMFRNTRVAGGLSTWNVSRVVSFRLMFNAGDVTSEFVGDISAWDVSSALDMSQMFKNAVKFNGDLSGWDVSRATDMREMFYGASSFIDGGISNWDISSVTNTNEMFIRASRFAGDLSDWDVSNVVDLSWMFRNALAFRSDLCQWGELIRANASVVGMFDGTACESVDRPNLSAVPPGPFCAVC